ncbi:hypothetical protein WA026_000881 [Henosepilachna vigintioctopunctata]|uniref:Uncharacterized protein n=1 Tax=Henosepilachna vigintioctopunctata TaxID=420089 RepID=A0AAW1V7D0_9CUCU
MSDTLICRICLKSVKVDEWRYLSASCMNEINKNGSLKDLLEECVSEVNLQLTDSPRICKECLVLLKIAIQFKKVCHNTEEQLYNYMKCNDCLEEYSNINLKEVIVNKKLNDGKDLQCCLGNFDQICRTCLKVSTGSNFVYMDKIIDINGITISVEVLAEYVSSICLQSAASLFICNECYEMLKNTYIFKQMCCETEEVLYNFMKLHDLHLDKSFNIQLIDVLNFKGKSQIFGGHGNDGCELSDSVVNHCGISVPGLKLPRLRREASKIANKKILSLSKQEFESDIQTLGTEEKNLPAEKCESFHSKSTSKKSKPNSLTHSNLLKFQSQSLKSSPKKYQSLPESRHFKCKKCQYKAFKLELLVRHKMKCKNRFKSMEDIYNKKCKYCSKTFNRNAHLKRHEFTHTLKSSHICEKCGQVFAEKYQLTNHEAKHTLTEGPLNCYHCSKKFFRSCDLNAHIKKTVLKQERYRCKFCKKEFYDSRDRLTHMSKYHTGEELPFECNNCSFSTAYSKRYNQHKKICI